MSNEPLLVTRETLYLQVWSEPIMHVATRMGLSGRGLGKLCARHGIPVPPRGWWAKKRHGAPHAPAKPFAYVRRRPLIQRRSEPSPSRTVVIAAQYSDDADVQCHSECHRAGTGCITQLKAEDGSKSLRAVTVDP